MFHPLTRAAVRRELRSRGVSFRESFVLAASLTDDDIDGAVQAVEGCPEAVGKIGDGTIIRAIAEFFESPLGKALIQLLTSLLLGL